MKNLLNTEVNGVSCGVDSVCFCVNQYGRYTHLSDVNKRQCRQNCCDIDVPGVFWKLFYGANNAYFTGNHQISDSDFCFDKKA